MSDYVKYWYKLSAQVSMRISLRSCIQGDFKWVPVSSFFHNSSPKISQVNPGLAAAENSDASSTPGMIPRESQPSKLLRFKSSYHPHWHMHILVIYYHAYLYVSTFSLVILEIASRNGTRLWKVATCRLMSPVLWPLPDLVNNLDYVLSLDPCGHQEVTYRRYFHCSRDEKGSDFGLLIGPKANPNAMSKRVDQQFLPCLHLFAMFNGNYALNNLRYGVMCQLLVVIKLLPRTDNTTRQNVLDLLGQKSGGSGSPADIPVKGTSVDKASIAN